MYISPLHGNDTDEDGQPKKPHIHVMVMFDSLKPLEACDDIIESVNGVKPPIDIFTVKSKRAYARYLLHYDDPGKYPYYKDSQVIAINGADDYDELIKSRSQKDFEERETMFDIQDFLEKNEIFNYAAAIRLARETENQEWFECLRVNAYYWHSWCKSHNDPSWLADNEKVTKLIKKSKGELT